MKKVQPKMEDKTMKGVILAGGSGTRLQPMTLVTNKHLLPIYDKPMIYYPINTLVSAGIKDIVIVTGSEHAGDFINLLGTGKSFGANFTYKVQEGSGGIAEALGLCKEVIGHKEKFAVILGDNIFEDDISNAVNKYEKSYGHAKVFLKKVLDPERFGVAVLDDGCVVEIVEKPKKPKSDLAVTGLYFYNASVWHIIDNLKPSDRGELEITDVNDWYVQHKTLQHEIIKGFWSDAGTIESLYRASTFAKERAQK